MIERVWDRTTLFLGEHLKTVLRIAIATIFVPHAVLGALAPVMAGGGAQSGLTALLAILEQVVLLWGEMALIFLVFDPALTQGQALRLSARRVPQGVGLLIMLIALTLLASVPGALILSAGGYHWNALAAGVQPGLPAGPTAPLFTLYILVALIGLLVVAARLTPVYAVVVAEGRVVGAITRAWALTRGLTAALVGVLLLYLIVSGITTLAARSVFGVIIGLIAPGSGPLGIGAVVTAILAAAVRTAFTVLATIFAAELYRGLVDRIGQTVRLAP